MIAWGATRPRRAEGAAVNLRAPDRSRPGADVPRIAPAPASRPYSADGAGSAQGVLAQSDCFHRLQLLFVAIARSQNGFKGRHEPRRSPSVPPADDLERVAAMDVSCCVLRTGAGNHGSLGNFFWSINQTHGHRRERRERRVAAPPVRGRNRFPPKGEETADIESGGGEGGV